MFECPWLPSSTVHAIVMSSVTITIAAETTPYWHGFHTSRKSNAFQSDCITVLWNIPMISVTVTNCQSDNVLSHGLLTQGLVLAPDPLPKVGGVHQNITFVRLWIPCNNTVIWTPCILDTGKTMKFAWLYTVHAEFWHTCNMRL